MLDLALGINPNANHQTHVAKQENPRPSHKAHKTPPQAATLT
jgi:hypothetical protein